MKLAMISVDGAPRVAIQERDGLVPLKGSGTLDDWLREGRTVAQIGALRDAHAAPVDPAGATWLPPLFAPRKIICAGLNYADHTKESSYEQPKYPTLFLRTPTTLVGHKQPIVRPLCSDSLDYEGEMAVILGKGGRHIPPEKALDCVFGYSVFNDASVREYQFKSPQWMIGKNFDHTGGFGPAIVTADELPPGAKGLQLTTTLNGKVVQQAVTSDMLYDVAALISVSSTGMTLQAGDVIVSGTPAGMGWARNPRLLMHDGDLVEVNIDQIGRLSNPIRDEKQM